jgi:SAM-dependent methyltransferase
MSDRDRWTAEQARAWGSGSWQDGAEALAPVHDHLVAALSPVAGERWLDLATGTGAVALRAARAGAVVTAQDLAAPLVETARALARRARLDIRFEVGDAQRLPYEDAGFDVVSSAYGVVFAADHVAVAGELARVCRPGGRIGLSYWRPNAEMDHLWEMVGSTRPAWADKTGDWGEPDYARALLGDAFELQFDGGVLAWGAESAQAVWDRAMSADGAAKSALARLSPADRAAAQREWVDFFERHRTADGVSFERPYLLILGRRRASRGR